MPTLLLVDDIEGIHDMLDVVFENTGIELEHAYLGQQAIEIYETKEIDVVLSDICMPGMDGLELFEKLKGIDPAITMIMTTASEERDFVIRALRMGAFDYIEKPYNEEDLQKRVKQAFIERRKRLLRAAGDSISNEETEKLKQELAARDKAIAEVDKKDAEIEKLRLELASNKEVLTASEKKRKELDKLRMQLEVKEGAMKTMEAVMKERMEKFKVAQNDQKREASGGLSAEAEAQLEELQTKLEAREAELAEKEISVQERELFVSETEESLMEKGMRLTEIEAELEQMREDIGASGGGGGMSAEEQAELEQMKAKLAEKEEALRHLEESIHEKERSIEKAEKLVKAREQFLEQSESILFGDSKG